MLRLSCNRFPRIRGDVPTTPSWRKPNLAFSPHTRGCSYLTRPQKVTIEVFPAYAGMFRMVVGVLSEVHGFPRIRGDVPFLIH